MISGKNLALLKKQHYAVAGRRGHSAVQICRWTKKSLRNEGACYKEKFYGIQSHRCCQMSPFIACPNQCVHCWRPIEIELIKLEQKADRLDKPEEIIDSCINAQRKLLSGFKGSKKTNMKKFKEAKEPNQFAISLIGEPTLYPYLAEFIKILRKQGKTSFVVSNGLYPEAIKKLEKKNALPTQLYISLNAPNKRLYDKWHRSRLKNAWKKFNKTLELMKKLKGKTRTVIRITLVRELNMQTEQIKEYAGLLKKAAPMFIEIKGFVSVGYARKRLGYDKMPNWKEVQDYAERIVKAAGCRILDKHEYSRVVLLGKPENRKRMKIKKSEI